MSVVLGAFSMSPEDFLARYWPHQFLAWTPPHPRWHDDPVLADLEDPELLVRRWRGPISLVHPDPTMPGGPPPNEVLPGSRARVPTAAAALPYLRDGFTAYLHDFHHQFRSLDPHREDIARSLNLHPDRVECEAFVTFEASGSSLHADRDINLQLQLTGVKSWQVAPNPASPAPLTIQVPDSPGGDHTALRAELKESSTLAEVGPGGAVFLPRGWWHATRTNGPSVGLNFVIKGPILADMLLREVRTQLVGDPRWRLLTAECDVRTAADLRPDMIAQVIDLLRDLLDASPTSR